MTELMIKPMHPTALRLHHQRMFMTEQQESSLSWIIPIPAHEDAAQRSQAIRDLPSSHPSVAVREIGGSLNDEDAEALDAVNMFVQAICTCGWDGAMTQSWGLAQLEGHGHLKGHLIG